MLKREPRKQIVSILVLLALKKLMLNISSLILSHLDLVCTDFQAWLELLDENIIIDFPFGPSAGGQARLEGKEAVISAIQPFLARVPNLRFRNPAIHPCFNKNEAFATYDAKVLVIDNGRIYQQNYVSFFKEKDGKITQITEYFDSVKMLQGLGP